MLFHHEVRITFLEKVQTVAFQFLAGHWVFAGLGRIEFLRNETSYMENIWMVRTEEIGKSQMKIGHLASEIL